MKKCDAWTPKEMEGILLMATARKCQRDEGHYPDTPHRYEGQQGNLVLEWTE